MFELEPFTYDACGGYSVRKSSPTISGSYPLLFLRRPITQIFKKLIYYLNLILEYTTPFPYKSSTFLIIFYTVRAISGLTGPAIEKNT